MKITAIKESGSNATLRWAIANKANPKTDRALASIINDELFYLITMSDVNFLELFRLTQMYREKLRICNEYQAEVPDRKSLVAEFNGTYSPNPDSSDSKAPLYEVVESSIAPFMNLALSMGTDDDIISPAARRLFIPMICRKFDVQIPIGFYELIEFMSEEESKEIFDPAGYPASLSTIIDSENSNIRNALTIGFVKCTSIIRYDKKYDQYIRALKYGPLKAAKPTSKLYKLGLLGFHKYDNVTRGEVRCSLNPAPPTREELDAALKHLNHLSTPLQIDFAVQLPIQYMQMIANSLPADVLKISYEASMASIIDEGMSYEDFTTPGIDPETEDPAEQAELEKFNNEITAYKVRIAEANSSVISGLSILLGSSNEEVNSTSAFAMLPSIYNAKAVFTLDLSKASEYENHYDPLIAEMFHDMLSMATSLTDQISKTK